MMGKKVRVSELRDIEILYKGDIYELACLILKLYDARDAGTAWRRICGAAGHMTRW